jgi:hypothetical protein
MARADDELVAVVLRTLEGMLGVSSLDALLQHQIVTRY